MLRPYAVRRVCPACGDDATGRLGATPSLKFCLGKACESIAPGLVERGVWDVDAPVQPHLHWICARCGYEDLMETAPSEGRPRASATELLRWSLRSDRSERLAAEAAASLARLLKTLAPAADPASDLLVLCTQLDNVTAGLQALVPRVGEPIKLVRAYRSDVVLVDAVERDAQRGLVLRVR